MRMWQSGTWNVLTAVALAAGMLATHAAGQANTAPTLEVPGALRSLPDMAVVFQCVAADVDLPAQNLLFSLDAGAPVGADITGDGLFYWTPIAGQAGTHDIAIRVTDDGVPPLAATGVVSIAVDGALVIHGGDILVANYGSDNVLRIDPVSGEQQILGEFTLPTDVAWDPAGLLYVTEAFGSVKRMDIATRNVAVVNPGTVLWDLRGLTIGPDGNLLVANGSDGSVVGIDPSTGVETVLTQGNLLTETSGLDLLDDDHLAVSSYDNHRLVSVALADGAQSLLVEGNGLLFPWGVAVFDHDPFVACLDDQLLVQVAGGAGTTVFADVDHDAMGVAADEQGNLVVGLVGPTGGAVRRVSPLGVVLDTYAGGLLSDPYGIDIVPDADDEDPTVQITQPTTLATYTAPANTVTLGGTASDDVSVALVSLRNHRCVGEFLAAGTTAWQYTGMPLHQGLNRISAIAVDGVGHSVTDVLDVTYMNDTLYTDVLRSGALVQNIVLPDNLTPGSVNTVQWTILSYVPVVCRIYAGVPGGWVTYRNADYVGQAPSTWNISGRQAVLYSFQCEWVAPQMAGDFDVWFSVAQTDHDQFMIPVIPDGVDPRPDPVYPKLIKRTVLPGGNGTVPPADPDMYNAAMAYESLDHHMCRSGATITGVTLGDNLVPGTQATCRWKVLSYHGAKAQLLLLNLGSQQVWLTANGTQVGAAVDTTFSFVDRTTGLRYFAKEYTFTAIFTVPNQPGDQQVFFRCQDSARPASMWMGANLSAGIDPRPAMLDGLYGRFIERTIAP